MKNTDFPTIYVCTYAVLVHVVVFRFLGNLPTPESRFLTLTVSSKLYIIRERM